MAYDIVREIRDILEEFELNEADAKEVLDDAFREHLGHIHNRAEAAYERQQEKLMENGGPADSDYRRSLKEAGRGHLLR